MKTLLTLLTCLLILSPNVVMGKTYACVQQGETGINNGQVEKRHPRTDPTILTVNGDTLIFDGEDYGKVHVSPDFADKQDKKYGSGMRGIRDKKGLYVHALRPDTIVRIFSNNETDEVDTLIHFVADSNSRVKPMRRWGVVTFWSCND